MLTLDRNEATVTVTLDHGPANALDTELCTELTSTIHQLDRDADVGAIVLAGRPGMFSAGVDLTRLDGADDQVIRDFLAALDGAFRSLLGSDTPIVGAITGHAIAGGAVLAAACDHAVVSDSDRVRLGLSELEVGVPFPTSAIEIVRQRCAGDAARLVWSGQLRDPGGALAARLVDELAAPDDVVATAQRCADRLAAVPATTRQLTREQLWADARERVAARGGTWEPQVVAAWCSPEARAAISRFCADRLR